MTVRLVLGPVLRYVDTTSAAVWVQTSAAATVTVRVEGHDEAWSGRTFAVHGHHYALVEVTGLAPGEQAAYRVELGGEEVWPEPDSPFPPSELRTRTGDGPLRLAFGSCRTSVPHDVVHHLTHGIDALRSYALGLAAGRGPETDERADLLLLLGDQVYADSTSTAMQEFIASRRSLDEEPGEELKDYVEYAHLYGLAWSEPALRWLLSCLPSLMIFDDHDVRDDWNTSVQWREQMEATSWCHDRIVAALASYWVYQHLGNLSPAERAEDEMWAELTRRSAAAGPEEGVDLTEALDAFAERVDQRPETYRWSYCHELGGARLVVVDSRAARLLQPGRRSMLDDDEMAWLDKQLRGDCEHLLVGTSLPYLLPPGLHHLEAWNEAMVDGTWGRRLAGLAERLRQVVDLEHWGAFTDGFDAVAQMVLEVADGARGRAPASVIFLSGDVHHSYISEVTRTEGSRILQMVCSPIRNPMPRPLRAFTAAVSHTLGRPVGAVLARSAKVPNPALEWRGVAGPWFDNNLAIMRVHGQDLRVAWVTGTIDGAGHDRPGLKVVADVQLDVPPAGTPRRPAVARVHRRSRPRARQLARLRRKQR